MLLDVTPLTLGIETLGGIMTPIIERNTTIPVRKKKIFTTASDYQTAVTIHVLQGERPMAKDNTSLGMFNLEGIPPAPRGVPQIEVTFDIDASGILHVSAKDLGTGKEQKITITASTKLSEEEIQKMIEEAKKYEEEDRKKKQEAEMRNNADTLIYTTEKMLSELGDKISREQKEKINKALKSLKEALEGKDIEKIKKEMENLQKVVGEAGASFYQKANLGNESAAKSESEREKSAKDDEKVVDAEYRVEDEENKQ